MKLPVNALLYLTSAGLLGLAGYTFYRTYPDGNQKALQDSSNEGIKEARDLMALGKSKAPQTQTTNYASEWWKAQFMAPNILGKEPPKEKPLEEGEKKGPVTTGTTQPLADIIELVAVMYDPTRTGKGDLSHVIVRYKGNVNKPDWYVRENQPLAASAGPSAGPGDAVAVLSGPRRGGPPAGRAGPRPTTPMPLSTAGQEILQKVWVAGDGTPRFEATLWDPYSDIRLVGVNEDSRSAYFVRTPPPPKEGETPPAPPAPEELFMTGLPLSQEVLKALADLKREDARRIASSQATKPVETETTEWIDDPSGETKRIKDRFHVGRKDQDLFSANDQAWMERVNAESYVGRGSSGLRGVLLRNVDPTLANRFGVQAGEVILKVNGETVETKADAVAVGRRQYDRGTRTFVVLFLSNGQRVERTYQMPSGHH